MYRFPCTRFVTASGIIRQLLHITSEFIEILKALAVGNLEHAVHESYDLIHSVETLIRKIVLRGFKRGQLIYPAVLELEVFQKNAVRGYYSHDN